jgi:YVTN family beta-propeller protein
MSGVEPYHLAFNQTNQSVYVAGASEGVIVIDAATHQKVTRFSTGYYVCDLAWSRRFNRVYSADYYSNSVTVADGQSNRVLTAISVVHPYRLLLHEALNKLYVASDSYVAVVDLASNAVQKLIPMPASPTALLLDSLRHRVYALGWLTNTLWIIDADEDSTVKVISLSGVEYAGLLAMSKRDNKLYCAGLGAASPGSIDTVDVVSLPDDSLQATIPVPPDPNDMVWNPDNDLIYVACQTEPGIAVLSCTGDSFTDTIDVPGPQRLVLDSIRNHVYAIGVNNGWFCVIDGNTQTVDTTVRIGAHMVAGLKPVGRDEIYIADEGLDLVTVFDCATANELARVPTGTKAVSVAWDSIDNCLYVANARSTCISVVDGSTLTVADTIHTSYRPYDLLWVPQNDKLYCTCQVDSSIWIVDCRNNQVLNTVQGHSDYNSMVYSPTSDKLYCFHFTSGSVTVVSGATNQVIATIRVDGTPTGPVWYPPTDRIYCGCAQSVVVIDCAHDSVVKRIAPIDGTGPSVLDTVNSTIYHACYGHNSSVAAIDPSRDSVRKTLTVGEWPTALAWNSRKNVLYCASGIGSSVAVIDCSADSITNVIEREGFVADVVWNSLDNELYVSMPYSNQVVALDAVSLQVLDSFATRGTPLRMAWDKVANRTFLPNWDGSCVSVLQNILPAVAEGPSTSLQAGRPALEIVGTPAKRQVRFFAQRCLRANPTVRIYDPAGRCVRTLFSVGLKGGQCQFLWNGADASGKIQPSGTYFARLTTGNGGAVKKVVFFSE